MDASFNKLHIVPASIFWRYLMFILKETYNACSNIGWVLCATNIIIGAAISMA